MRMLRSLVLLVLAMSLFSGLSLAAPSTIHASGGVGQVCNRSSVMVWITAENFSLGRWVSYRLYPGGCTDRQRMDVEGVWGRLCNNYGCWYETWKVGASSLSIYDGGWSNSQPYRVLRLSGLNIGGSWVDGRGTGWPLPTDLGTIGYSLRW